jgi:tetratricopeptide (TPR) repeat protein
VSRRGRRAATRQGTAAATPAGARPGTEDRSGRRRTLARELPWLLPAVVAAFLVFANALRGDFVYDDQRQIVRNTLIQDPALLGRALASDVWAFKGGAGANSNYWRPTFVAWLAANDRLFGLQSTVGWHLGNVLLHVLATALLFVVARRLGLAPPLAGAVALLFAVHPVHTESVAWISGVPDLLVAVALLAALALVLGARPARWRWPAALALYALALGAKEVALLVPLGAGVAGALDPARETATAAARWRRGLLAAAPFALLALVDLGLRQAILGRFARPYAGGADLAATLLTVPRVALFYLRQLALPLTLGPSYPLRAVTPESVGFASFWLPLLCGLAVLSAVTLWVRRRPAGSAGLALALVTLAPAFDLGAFHPEQLVHDRYLYLPLAGFLLAAVPLVERGLARWPGLDPPRATFALAALLALPLAAQTWSYNRAWLSEIPLWQRGVATDPGSAFNQLELGAALEGAGRLDEARAALDRSLALHPIPNARVARARVAAAQGRFADAQRDLGALLGGEATGVDAYTLYQAWEALAIAEDRQGRPDEAARDLRAARAALPIYAAALTEKLAIELYQSGRKAEALAELEAYRIEARREPLPESRRVLFRLGLLYAELGREAEARRAWQEYLDVTATLADPPTLDLRRRVEAALRTSAR